MVEKDFALPEILVFSISSKSNWVFEMLSSCVAKSCLKRCTVYSK